MRPDPGPPLRDAVMDSRDGVRSVIGHSTVDRRALLISQRALPDGRFDTFDYGPVPEVERDRVGYSTTELGHAAVTGGILPPGARAVRLVGVQATLQAKVRGDLWTLVVPCQPARSRWMVQWLETDGNVLHEETLELAGCKAMRGL